jgi:hypothetical protein
MDARTYPLEAGVMGNDDPNANQSHQHGPGVGYHSSKETRPKQRQSTSRVSAPPGGILRNSSPLIPPITPRRSCDQTKARCTRYDQVQNIPAHQARNGHSEEVPG